MHKSGLSLANQDPVLVLFGLYEVEAIVGTSLNTQKVRFCVRFRFKFKFKSHSALLCLDFRETSDL